MGFFSNIISAAVKTALTPVAVTVDAVKLATGEDADTTSDLLTSAAENVTTAVEDLTEGEII
jgi:DNA-binding protein YbaB